VLQAAGFVVMSIGQSLSQLVLKRLVEDVFTIGGADALDGIHDFLKHCGQENGPRLTAVMDQSLERAWRALEVALEDDPFWDHGQVGLAPGDAQAFRQRLELVLAELARGGAAAERPELARVEAALRRQCLWELRAAREAGALAGCLDADEWARTHEVSPRPTAGQGSRDGELRAEGELFHEFEERGCVGLMRVLTGSGGLPLLVLIVRAFVCQGLGRLLRYCLQERPERTPIHCALVMDVLRAMSTPRFSARRATTLATDEMGSAPVPTADITLAARPAAEARDAQPRRYDRRNPSPDRQPLAHPPRRPLRPSSLPSVSSLPRVGPRRTRPIVPERERSPWIMRGVLILGLALLVARPVWFLVTEARQRSAEQRQVAAERQRLAEEVRRLDEERRLLVERQQRLAEAEAARRRQAERQRREQARRRLAEAEEARRNAEEIAVRRREEERQQREADRLARLREEKERRERARIVFERGLTHAACRRDEQALAAFTETLQLDPSLARAWTERGLVRQRLGDREHALADFSEAVRRDPRDVRAWLHRGELHAARHDNSLAIESFSAVIRLQPRNECAYRERGACHVHNYDYPLALADETTAIALAPDDPWPYFHRANIHLLRNDLGKAFDDYSAAIDHNRDNDPALAPAYRQRGTIRLKREEYAAAITDLTRAIQFNPMDVAARQERGLAHLKRGDWDNAILDAGEVIRLDSENAESYKIRGQAHLAREDYGAARADLTRAIALHHTDPEGYYLRAYARSRLGEIDEAIFDCNDAIARNPYLASAYYLRGTLLIQQNDRAGGMADRRKAHELNPHYPKP
jgi:tetratricopeptide (TPR) repeat protein